MKSLTRAPARARPGPRRAPPVRVAAIASAVVTGAAAATLVMAQYALDANQWVNTQVSGVGYEAHADMGQRNTYSPGLSVQPTPSPYSINRATGTFHYNPNTAFARPTYRPTGYGLAGGSAAYHSRIRY